ncbi:MAG: phosphoribosylglycinamide formyltransferase [Bacteroidales bacterium]|nr:phosphoribosylglycinamide formyltransferase [Bacteroidales bacterium]MDD4669467.1 phosphoribosylglycinamide formyltransferase [Bacteroidales bacterium]
MKHIAIFASGSGTNAENLVRHFNESGDIKVSVIFCNNPKAYVIHRAEQLNVPCRLFTKNQFSDLEEMLVSLNIDYIILAGFLLKVPENIISAYRGRIINIHPALLPKYGGRGMYGMNVHNAVIEAGEKESGITIHLIDEHYDRGVTLFQAKCTIEAGDTPEMLAAKIHILEQANFPQVVENYIKRQ